MFGINKMSTLLVRINSLQISTIYNIQALRKLLEDLQKNILVGVILVDNRYSEQSVCNLTKRRTVPPAFSRGIFENGWLQKAVPEQREIAAYNIIRSLTIKISFGILFNVRLNMTSIYNFEIQPRQNLYSLQNKRDHDVLRDSHSKKFQ